MASPFNTDGRYNLPNFVDKTNRNNVSNPAHIFPISELFRYFSFDTDTSPVQIKVKSMGGADAGKMAYQWDAMQ